MIELEFTSSPNPELIGKFQYFFEIITFGNSQLNDLILEDPNLTKERIVLKNTPNGVIVYEKSDGHYFSNGKKVSGWKLHKPGDEIRIGETTFKILNHAPITEFKITPDVYEKAIQEAPGKEKILQALKAELIRLQQDI